MDLQITLSRCDGIGKMRQIRIRLCSVAPNDIRPWGLLSLHRGRQLRHEHPHQSVAGRDPRLHNLQMAISLALVAVGIKTALTKRLQHTNASKDQFFNCVTAIQSCISPSRSPCRKENLMQIHKLENNSSSTLINYGPSSKAACQPSSCRRP